jgi:hypothetical protein
MKQALTGKVVVSTTDTGVRARNVRLPSFLEWLFAMVSVALFAVIGFLLITQSDVLHALIALIAAVACGILPRLDRVRSLAASRLGVRIVMNEGDKAAPKRRR